MNLDAAITDVLDRLGDLANTIWNRDEIKQYYKDGYDTFCRRGRPFFDQHVIENLPPSGNWQSDFERWEALQRPGWGVTDMPFNMNSERDRNRSPGNGRVGESYATMPTGITSPTERQFADSVDNGAGGVNKSVAGGRLPPSTIEVLQVAWNSRVLVGSTTLAMRQLDPNYQIRVGDPQSYLWDQDGLYFMRFVPMASGNAEYPDIFGGFGTITTINDGTPSTSVPTPVEFWHFDETPGALALEGGGGEITLEDGSKLLLEATVSTWYGALGTSSFVTNTGSPTSVVGKSLSGVYNGDVTSDIHTSTTFSGTASNSVSFWWKPVTVPGGQTHVIFGFGDSSVNAVRIAYDQAVSPGHIVLENIASSVYGTTTIVPGTWYNIIYTYDSSTHIQNVYLNGALEITRTQAPTSSSNGPLIFRQGTVDEAGYWNSVLTTSAIADLYNSGDGSFYPNFLVDQVTTVVTVDVNGNDTGGFGILNYIDGSEGDQEVGLFPAYGPWGSPTQIHPHTNNFVIEITRLGRDLDAYPIELPLAYQKYVIYWAMAHALRRDGPGQDMALSEHYMSRFEMGVSRMELHRDKMNRDRLGAFGARTDPVNFTLGLPQLPYPYDSNQWS